MKFVFLDSEFLIFATGRSFKESQNAAERIICAYLV